MCQLRKLLIKIIISLTIALVIISFPIFSLSQTAQASTIEISQNSNPIVEFWHRLKLRRNPPRRAEATGRKRPGGGRGSICALADDSQNRGENKTASSIIALTPVRTVNENGDLVDSQEENLVSPDTGIVGGFTVEAQPTFWFYIPYILIPKTSNKRVAQFILLDEADHPVLKELVSIELLDHPQLIKYLLPYSLKTNKLYKWYFSVICDAEKRSRNPSAQGWVQRIELTSELQTALSIDSPIEQQYKIYAENGIWFEAVSSLINNRYSFSGDERKDWNGLLSYFEIAEEDTNLSLLQIAEPVDREVLVNGNQLPARM